MPYTVQQLARLAGVSVRTLHHYDAVGLLKPARILKNGYRQYGEKELLTLQQILFFRELDFSLEDIGRILSSPSFDMKRVLQDQRNLIQLKKKRLTTLIATIDTTLKKINNEISMEDKELYNGLSQEEIDTYTAEAKERWGNTDAWKQSQKRTKHMTKEDFARIAAEGDVLMKAMVVAMPQGPKSVEVQELIARHFNALRTFYEPTFALYRGLADMYVADPRFAAYYEKYATGLASFMKEAMRYYADIQEGK